MNYKYLSGIFAVLLGVSLTFNTYQSMEHNSFSTNNQSIRRVQNKQILIYERIIEEYEKKDKINKENLKMLEKRVENIEKRFSPNYFPKSNKYTLQRFL